MSDLAQHAQSIQEAFESLSQASSRLRESASALDREVRHFNVK
jgi:methyl-accepting chemotaxis protein